MTKKTTGLWVDNEPLVSIIIPVFNKAKYISECLSSVVRQTWKNLEIIVIDDGSTDESPSLIKTVSQGDYRVKDYHIDHSGVSAARNQGLKLAHGVFVTFIDADDLIRTDYIEVLFSAIKDAEISLCSKWIWNQHLDSVKIHSCENAEYTKDEFLNSSKSVWDLCSNAFAKLYRASFLKKYQILFQDSLDFGEDTLFFYNCLQFAEHINTTNHTEYLYREETDSSLANRCVFDLHKNELLISALQSLYFSVQDDPLRSLVTYKQFTLLFVIGKVECFQETRGKRGSFFFSCADKYNLKCRHHISFKGSKSASLAQFILRINNFVPFYIVIRTFYKNVREKRVCIPLRRRKKQIRWD